MSTARKWFKILLGGGVLLIALALVVGLAIPLTMMLAGPGMFGPMSGMTPALATSASAGASVGCCGMGGPFGWLWVLPLLLLALGILSLAGAVIVWLAQRP